MFRSASRHRGTLLLLVPALVAGVLAGGAVAAVAGHAGAPRDRSAPAVPAASASAAASAPAGGQGFASGPTPSDRGVDPAPAMIAQPMFRTLSGMPGDARLLASDEVRLPARTVRLELVGTGSQQDDLAIGLFVFDARTGAVVRQPEDPDLAGVGYAGGHTLTVDRAGRVFVPAIPGNAQEMWVAQLGDTGDVTATWGDDSSMAAHNGVAARDVVGDDGVLEVVAHADDCQPTCADGADIPVVWQYQAGRGFVRVGA